MRMTRLRLLRRHIPGTPEHELCLFLAVFVPVGAVGLALVAAWGWGG